MAGTPTHLADAAAAAAWLAAKVSGTLRSDSRDLRPGDGYLAWPGRRSDGRDHVAAALAAGAVACLVEREGAEAWDFDDERIALLPGLKAAAGAIADAFFGAPSAALDVVAVTGTNGKTSTSWWTAQALTQLGRRCGLVGTLGIGEPPPASLPGVAAGDAAAAGGTVVATGLTTPDPVTLHAALRAQRDAGFQACAIEASSIGLAEHRLAGLRIDVAAFTNFTRDHLDYHASMADYWTAKRALFDWPGLGAAVVNVDDAQGAQLASELSGTAIDLWTVSLHGPARLQGSALRYGPRGLAFDVAESGGAAAATLHSGLVGDFNASNLLVVLGILRALGVPLADAAAAAGGVTAVPGRLQRLEGGGVAVVVDYAHTPDALQQVLAALRPLAAARGGQLWCVFGCGGDRDATKRPLMGAIAACGADRVVVTSDNPRDEAPDLILAQVLAGMTGHDDTAVYEDRREAIAHAVGTAAPGDVVLIAGKGHEDYQEVAGVRRPFSDVAEAQAALQARAAGGTGAA